MARWIPAEQMAEEIAALVRFRDEGMLSPWQQNFIDGISEREAISPKQAAVITKTLADLAKPVKDHSYPANVLKFPAYVWRNVTGEKLIWYAGRGYRSGQHLCEHITDGEHHRLTEWERRRFPNLGSLDQSSAGGAA
jgi:hypothetical protein